MSDPITIRRLIDKISSGDIRIPAFQRDYVWEPDQVAFLLDSIYKGFPIGTVIFWRTENRLTTEKSLGHFTLPEPQKSYPVNYVLDGQQRITSLFSVFQTELTPNSTEWIDIYFDLEAVENLQESSFLALEDSEVDLSRHFPVKVFFDSVKYRRALEHINDEQIRKIDSVQSKFSGYLIPNQVFETDDRNEVAIVFERINRAGTELNIFELLSAWSWSESFNLIDQFDSLQEKISDYGFGELCKDRDLQLRVCAGIITGETSPSKILELQGDEIRDRFAEIERGILGALDFIKRELNIPSYKLIPFPGLLVPLSAFFATDRVEGLTYTPKQRDVLVKWFWRSVFSRRFSAGVNERQAYDIENMLGLKLNEDFDFKLPKSEIKFDFAKSNFSSGNANSKTHILLLNSMRPKSLVSGSVIDLNNALKKASKNEFHHIFPKKYLEREGIEKKAINVLANICFLTRADNNSISDKAPSDYVNIITKSKVSEYLDLNLIPQNFHEQLYSEFLLSRVKLLESRALELME